MRSHAKEDFVLIKKILINLYNKKKKITMNSVIQYIKQNKNAYMINLKRNSFAK